MIEHYDPLLLELFLFKTPHILQGNTTFYVVTQVNSSHFGFWIQVILSSQFNFKSPKVRLESTRVSELSC